MRRRDAERLEEFRRGGSQEPLGGYRIRDEIAPRGGEAPAPVYRPAPPREDTSINHGERLRRQGGYIEPVPGTRR